MSGEQPIAVAPWCLTITSPPTRSVAGVPALKSPVDVTTMSCLTVTFPLATSVQAPVTRSDLYVPAAIVPP